MEIQQRYPAVIIDISWKREFGRVIFIRKSTNNLFFHTRILMYREMHLVSLTFDQCQQLGEDVLYIVRDMHV